MNDEVNTTDEGQDEKAYHCPNCSKELKGAEVPPDMKCPDCSSDLVEGTAPETDGVDDDEDWDFDDDDDDEPSTD